MTTYNWHFLANMENWIDSSPNPANGHVDWNGADGSPAVGCMELHGLAGNYDYQFCQHTGDLSNGGADPITLGTTVDYRYRLIHGALNSCSGVTNGITSLSAIAHIGGLGHVIIATHDVVGLNTDTGWISNSVPLAVYAGQNLLHLAFQLGPMNFLWCPERKARLDEIAATNLGASSAKLDFLPGSAASLQGLLDVDEDDEYLYVAAKYSGFPELLQLDTSLAANPTEVYVPGAGTDINVKCGSKDADWVWIAGAFAGNNKVCVSINDGGAWTVKLAPAGVGVAIPLVVGPDDDNAVLVPTDTTDDLYATVNGGLSWANPNVNLPFDVGAMDRLDLNPDEIMIGDRAAADVRYSPNGGVSFHDISLGLPIGKPVRDLIIG